MNIFILWGYRENKDIQNEMTGMKASLAEEEVSIVKESLRRELALSEAKVNLIREEIEGFEKRYEMSPEEFMDKFERGELGDAQDFFEWWGLVKGLKKIEEQI